MSNCSFFVVFEIDIITIVALVIFEITSKNHTKNLCVPLIVYHNYIYVLVVALRDGSFTVHTAVGRITCIVERNEDYSSYGTLIYYLELR